MDDRGHTGPDSFFGQRPAFRFRGERQSDQSHEENQTHPRGRIAERLQFCLRLHGGISSGRQRRHRFFTQHRLKFAQRKRTGGRNESANVIAKTRARAAQAGREQLRKVNGKTSKKK